MKKEREQVPEESDHRALSDIKWSINGAQGTFDLTHHKEVNVDLLTPFRVKMVPRQRLQAIVVRTATVGILSTPWQSWSNGAKNTDSLILALCAESVYCLTLRP